VLLCYNSVLQRLGDALNGDEPVVLIGKKDLAPSSM
jgi:hypothetical protein